MEAAHTAQPRGFCCLVWGWTDGTVGYSKEVIYTNVSVVPGHGGTCLQHMGGRGKRNRVQGHPQLHSKMEAKLGYVPRDKKEEFVRCSLNSPTDLESILKTHIKVEREN